MREGERERGGGEARGEGRDLCRDDGLRFEGGEIFFSSSFPESRARFSVAAKKTSPGLKHMDEILKSIRRSGKLDKVLPHPNRRRRRPSNNFLATTFSLSRKREESKKNSIFQSGARSSLSRPSPFAPKRRERVCAVCTPLGKSGRRRGRVTCDPRAFPCSHLADLQSRLFLLHWMEASAKA
jgi:hypothetical protein